MRGFCRQENISFNGLRYWKNKEADRTDGSRPVKLLIPIVPSVNLRAVIEVMVGDRFRVRVPEGFQSGELERVIRSLESVR